MTKQVKTHYKVSKEEFNNYLPTIDKYSKHIMSECFIGDISRDRTLTEETCDFVVDVEGSKIFIKLVPKEEYADV